MKRSATDYTGKALEKVARKLGYIIVEGKRHTRVYDSEDRYITTLPRGKIKKGTLSAILRQMGLTETELKKLL